MQLERIDTLYSELKIKLNPKDNLSSTERNNYFWLSYLITLNENDNSLFSDKPIFQNSSKGLVYLLKKGSYPLSEKFFVIGSAPIIIISQSDLPDSQKKLLFEYKHFFEEIFTERSYKSLKNYIF